MPWHMMGVKNRTIGQNKYTCIIVFMLKVKECDRGVNGYNYDTGFWSILLLTT